MSINPDVLYLKQREGLLSYEDAEFNFLMAQVPNSYLAMNDSVLWGAFVRAVAQELARLDYDSAYDLVNLEPQFLTPPDIRRKYAAPLQVQSSFPADDQFDVGYRNMLVALLAAYPEGATLKAIEDVITAYTNLTVPVVELYKEIGNGYYDDTYRNTLLVNIAATGANPVSQTVSADLLATLSGDLYNAIDIAKPAHIGLEYAIVFSTGEQIETVIETFTDKLTIVFELVETDGIGGQSLPPEFIVSPWLKTEPNTRLTAWGQNVGKTFTQTLTYNDWAALPPAFQSEYIYNPTANNYFLNPTCYQDTALVDENGNTTGEISKAVGVLEPKLKNSWMITGDTLKIYRLD
jgi:hypothetical protein